MDTKLRIAMLSTHSSPAGHLGAWDTGGMSVYVREVSSELGRQGHLVDIYTRIHNSDEKPVIELGENTRLIHLKAGEEDLRKIAIYPYFPEFSYYLENFRKDNNLEYDLIFSHYWLSGCVGELARIWWRVPHITMFHTLAAVKNTIGEHEPELRLRTETDLARSCDRIIVGTEREKQNLIKYYDAPPERISVIPCGVNLELFKPLPKRLAKANLGLSGKKTILFVGRIEPLKGIDRLIRATSLLKNTQSQLIIIGGDEESTPEIEKLQKLATALRISNSVNFLGSVEQNKLPSYYSAADVTVVPSHYESFGLVALESLACGTPVVATDVGDLRNIIQPGITGYIAETGTPQEIAEKIDLVLSRPDNESSGSIRNTVLHFGWQVVAREVARTGYQAIADYSESSLAELMCKELSF